MARPTEKGTPLRVQIRVELADKIRELADADRRPASQIVEMLLERALKRKKHA